MNKEQKQVAAVLIGTPAVFIGTCIAAGGASHKNIVEFLGGLSLTVAGPIAVKLLRK